MKKQSSIISTILSLLLVASRPKLTQSFICPSLRNARTSLKSIEPVRSSASSTSSTSNESLQFDWRKVCKAAFIEDKRPIILFDGVCNLCNGGVNFALDHDSTGVFRFASLQSKTGQALLLRSGKAPNDISSIVLVTEESSYFKSDAVLRISKELDGNKALPVIGTIGPLFPKFLRNKVYDVVADNRYRFGESDSCRLDGEEFDGRFVPDPEEQS